MADVARRSIGPVLPERHSSYAHSSALDDDAINRIRSLLVSRIGHHPSRKTCPSPEITCVPLNSYSKGLGLLLFDFEPETSQVDQSAEKAAPIELRKQGVGADNFDGPASQSKEYDLKDHPRFPSQPDPAEESHLRSGGSKPDRSSSFQDHLGHQDLVSQGIYSTENPDTESLSRSSTRSISMSSKRSATSRVPIYNFRTIAPSTSYGMNELSRSEILHVPGSYQPEVDMTTSQSPRSQSPPPKSGSLTEHHLPNSPQTHSKLDLNNHSQAVEALIKARDHDCGEIRSHSNQTLRKARSQTTLRYTTSTLQSNYTLSVLMTDSPSLAQAAEPILTLGTDHAPSLDEKEQISQFTNNRYDTTRRASPVSAETSKNLDGANASPVIDSVLLPLTYLLPPPRDTVFHPKSSNSDLATATSPSDSKVLDNGDKEKSDSVTFGEHASRGTRSDQMRFPPPFEFSDNKDSANDENRLPRTPPISSSGKRQNSDNTVHRVNPIRNSNTDGDGNAELKPHWIRQLISSASTNFTRQGQPNLTARPSHSVSYATSDAIRQCLKRSPSRDDIISPAIPDEKLIFPQAKSTESFTKAIQDLESLLKEALFIARRATDSDDRVLDHSAPSYPVGHDTISQFGVNTSHSSYESLNSNSSFSSCSGGPDEEENYATVQPQFSSTGGISQSALTKSKHDGIHLARSTIVNESPQPFTAHDWALNKQPSQTLNWQPQKSQDVFSPRTPDSLRVPWKRQRRLTAREDQRSASIASGAGTQQGISGCQRPFIQQRTSSARLGSQQVMDYQLSKMHSLGENVEGDDQIFKLRPLELQHRTKPQYMMGGRVRGYSFRSGKEESLKGRAPSQYDPGTHVQDPAYQGRGSIKRGYSLTGRRHWSLREAQGFSLRQAHRRAPLARDWSTSRKRYVAIVTCVNTALMGFIVGIYAGEVPAIQYAIADEHHYTIMGNVGFFIGLATTTAFLWPLPLLHGRKPYTLAAFAILLPLQFPQAMAVEKPRSPYVATFRVALLLSRAVSGIIMGFANINFKTTLLDLFGASLQSAHPHQEMVDTNDVRRHGGGMGVWLGIWTWCSIGSIGVGFFIGAMVISGLNVAWGFWLTIILTAFALLLNVLVPEVRRSPYRRSTAEVRDGGDVSRRVARGEIKMHLDSTGPIWWWEEVAAGHRLCLRLLKQPGFAILSLYMGWIYGQIVMVIMVCR